MERPSTAHDEVEQEIALRSPQPQKNSVRDLAETHKCPRTKAHD